MVPEWLQVYAVVGLLAATMLLALSVVDGRGAELVKAWRSSLVYFLLTVALWLPGGLLLLALLSLLEARQSHKVQSAVHRLRGRNTLIRKQPV